MCMPLTIQVMIKAISEARRKYNLAWDCCSDEINAPDFDNLCDYDKWIWVEGELDEMGVIR